VSILAEVVTPTIFDQGFTAFQQDKRMLSLECCCPIGRPLMLVVAEWNALLDR
jgi:hypothetical protein